MQDIEFTIQKASSGCCRRRTGKRTGAAAVRIAVDMARSSSTRKTAILRVDAGDARPAPAPLVRPQGQERAKEGRDLPRASPPPPAPPSGKPVFTPPRPSSARAQRGEKVILVRKETSPEDIEGMHSPRHPHRAGGMTSHAASSRAAWGKCCVAGAGELASTQGQRSPSAARPTGRLTVITIDGSTGEVMLGRAPSCEPTLSATSPLGLMKWADKVPHHLACAHQRRHPADASARATSAPRASASAAPSTCSSTATASTRRARDDPRRDDAERREGARQAAADAARGLRRPLRGDGRACPVTIRLLDPPLHEFLPHEPEARSPR
jgi:pyruvate,orthophosphate dikinase